MHAAFQQPSNPRSRRIDAWLQGRKSSIRRRSPASHPTKPLLRPTACRRADMDKAGNAGSPSTIVHGMTYRRPQSSSQIRVWPARGSAKCSIRADGRRVGRPPRAAPLRTRATTPATGVIEQQHAYEVARAEHGAAHDDGGRIPGESTSLPHFKALQLPHFRAICFCSVKTTSVAASPCFSFSRAPSW